MNDDQIKRGSDAVCWMGQDKYSKEIWSISKFFHCAMFVLFLDFQFMRIVFLAIVREVRSTILFNLFKFVVDVSPSKQSGGDKGIWHPKKTESDLVTFFQNCWTGVQCHIA